MLNEVRIFKASVFNLELDSNFTNSKLDARNLSQGDEVIRFTARSYDLSRYGVAQPLVGSLSAVSFYLYSAAVCWLRSWLLSRRSFTKLRRWSAHPCRSRHQLVLRESSCFTETIILHKQHATCQLSWGHRRRHTGITQHHGILKSDHPRQPPGHPGRQSWHVNRWLTQW